MADEEPARVDEMTDLPDEASTVAPIEIPVIVWKPTCIDSIRDHQWPATLAHVLAHRDDGSSMASIEAHHEMTRARPPSLGNPLQPLERERKGLLTKHV